MLLLFNSNLMKDEKNFCLLFYMKKPKNYVSSEMPIYMRITVDGVSKELSTGKLCDPAHWNSKTCRLDGRKEITRITNQYLKTVEDKIEQAHIDLIKAGEVITTDSLKNKYLGVVEQPHTLITVFQEHNDKIKALIGNGFEKGTLTKYNSTLKHTKSFILTKYHVTDFQYKVDNFFISEYKFYLWSSCNCANDAAVKHIKNFGNIIRICLANRWMNHDPFLNHRNKIDKVVRVILTPDELQEICQKEFCNRTIKNCP
jgi:hypothetical protein